MPARCAIGNSARSRLECAIVAECSRTLDPQRRGEPDEDDERPDHHVEDEVVGRGHHGEAHRGRHADREHAHEHLPGRPEDDDPDEQVPAEVQAGHRRVLIRQLRGLQRAVGGRLLRDGVHEAEVEKARRCHREEGEEEEADRAGDEDGVP